MNEKSVKKYFKEHKVASIPEIQNKLDLGYKETHEIFLNLLEDKVIVLKDDLHYEYIKNAEAMEDVPNIYKKVLWNCIQTNDASSRRIRRDFSLSSSLTNQIFGWMIENDYISDPLIGEILITKEEFIETFGEMEDDEFNISKYVDLSEVFNEANGSAEEQYDRVLKRIIESKKNITQEVFISIVRNIIDNLFMPNSSLEHVYDTMLQNVSQMTEEQFQELTKYILNN